jgi:choline dehydrogenase-like flavoprotein
VLHDARELSDGTSLSADLCIIGAGAAGITLARAFAGTSVQVVVLESGGTALDGETQALYQGESVGLPYFDLDAARLRYFGGSTNHWGGLCLTFRALDFEARDWIPGSGWPIGLDDLEPHYGEARRIVQLSSDEFDAAAWVARDPHQPFELGPDVEARVAQMVDPSKRSFATLFGDDLERAANVDVYLHANVMEIETDEQARTVTGVRARTFAGAELRVQARQHVLAAGGIENPRLLLASNRHRPAGLGNDHDVVGRYFLEHPRFDSAVVVPDAAVVPARFYEAHQVDGTEIQGYLALTEAAQRREELVDVQVLTLPIYAAGYERAEASDDVAAFRRLVRDRGDDLGRIGEDLLAVARDLTTHRAVLLPGTPLPVPYPDVVGRLLGDETPSVHVPAILGDLVAVGHRASTNAAPVDHIRLRARLDPVPNPDSRITLSDQRDALGMRRAKLDWRLTETDRRSAARTMEVLGAGFAAAGVGRLRLVFDPSSSEWPESLTGGWHHMGTTRMGTDPATSVVDGDCRVHGIDNLHVAGSSVFTTGGSATPTLTIVALALRLADRLRGILR